MKKLIYAVCTLLIIASCSKDTLDNTTSEANLTAQFGADDLGTFKGIFTTDNADFRGTVEINLPTETTNTLTKVNPRAMISLSNGAVEVVYAKQVDAIENGGRQFTFANGDVSFVLTVDQNGKNPSITNNTYKQLAASMVVANHSERAPVTPISGTFECGICNSHPVLGTGVTQTFNLMLVDDGMGSITVNTQTTLGGTTYTGVGFQDAGSCADVGTTTTCDLNSGISGGSSDGFVVNGNPVTWSGSHAFNNEPTANGNDASTVSGTWSWDSISFGTITGTFTGDGAANVLPILEDFEDTDVTYISSVAEFNDGDSDFFTRTDGSDIDTDYSVMGTSGSSWFAVQDTNADGGPNTLSLNWENIDVTGLTTITFAADFGEDDDGSNEDWDANSSVRVEYSFDNGNTWTDIIRFEADIPSGSNGEPALDTDGDGVGDGTPLTDTMANFTNSFATSGNTQVDVRILIVNLNDGDEDLSIDDVTITGI